MATENAKTEREKNVFDYFRKGRGRSLFVNSSQRYAKYVYEPLLWFFFLIYSKLTFEKTSKTEEK